jgi:hypothetical protein
MDDSPPDYPAQTMEPAPAEMNAARQSVVVRAPVAKVYEQWSRFEDLPKFIKPLRRVERIDASHFSYTWHPNGEEEQGGLPHLASNSRAENSLAIYFGRFHVGRRFLRAPLQYSDGNNPENTLDFRSSPLVAKTGRVSWQFQTVG